MRKIISLTFILFFLQACSKKSNSIRITDFSKPAYDTLIPNMDSTIPWMDSYAVQIFKIEGTSNDTIQIVFDGIERKYIGNFKDGWEGDYYGGLPVIFEFDPYKANLGQILVSYSIQ